MWKAATDRILAVLTDEQRARWQELIGRPFARRKMDFRMGPKGPGPGGPRPPW
jgi:hypothetical protein